MRVMKTIAFVSACAYVAALAMDPVNAVNHATGERKWRYEMLRRPAGLMATGGGLIFMGDTDGYLIALDANTGKVLWHFQTGAEIKAPPIGYSLRGRQLSQLPRDRISLPFTFSKHMFMRSLEQTPPC
jgi:glucose dehydrogenase